MPLDDIGHFLEKGLEAVAGVRQPLVAFAARAAAHSSASAGADAAVRVLPGAFMAINQAMGMVHGRAEGAAYLWHFVEEMKASGFQLWTGSWRAVAKWARLLRRQRIQGCRPRDWGLEHCVIAAVLLTEAQPMCG